jgi:calcineurin-like phosphoesterase family protein
VIYFWSDTHFNHAKIIELCVRKYPSVEMMNYSLIDRWNGCVGRKDTVYLLGDFAFPSRTRTPADIFSRLNGHKHLVVGNHDEANKEILRLNWESVATLKVVKAEGRRAVLCHYPLESWYGAHRGVLHFHGHCHGNLKRKVPHRFDVGVDVWPYGPVSWDELDARAAGQTFEASDHHGDM